VRGAERLGVSIRREESQSAIAAYYRIFAEKIRSFGRRPMYSEQFYRELLERGRGAVRLYLAYQDDDPMGGHLNFYYKDMVIAWYSVVASEHERTQVGSLLFAVCMRDACDEGYATYNLGASLGKESLTRFKRSLGGIPHRYPVHVTRSLLGRLVETVRS
jgi:CelD/BcsL family acetyltransferase involved in cellulose biosynthesis